jgi:dihydrofolate reductase
MTGIVYIATSLDGFIARIDGGLDWLPTPADGDDLGFGKFFKTIDALVMGRNTYDMVLSFGAWAYGSTPVVVLTHRPLMQPEDPTARVESMSASPEEVVAELSNRSFNNLYIDGGQTIQEFMRAGQIHRVIITRIPVLLGQGIPLFGELEEDVQLKCIRTERLSNGLEQAEYLALQPGCDHILSEQ